MFTPMESGFYLFSVPRSNQNVSKLGIIHPARGTATYTTIARPSTPSDKEAQLQCKHTVFEKIKVTHRRQRNNEEGRVANLYGPYGINMYGLK